MIYSRNSIKEPLNKSPEAGRRIFCPIRSVLKTGNTCSIPPFSELSAEPKSFAASCCRFNQRFLKTAHHPFPGMQYTIAGRLRKRACRLCVYSTAVPAQESSGTARCGNRLRVWRHGKGDAVHRRRDFRNDVPPAEIRNPGQYVPFFTRLFTSAFRINKRRGGGFNPVCGGSIKEKALVSQICQQYCGDSAAGFPQVSVHSDGIRRLSPFPSGRSFPAARSFVLGKRTKSVFVRCLRISVRHARSIR